MKRWLITLSLISGAALVAFQGQPRCTAMDPDTAKTGDMVTATCENVNKSTVADVYLTDGKDDTKVAIMENSTDKIKFTVPKIKPGRYHIALLTANKSSMIEQPVALSVEE
jgi:hypothetical protein